MKKTLITVTLLLVWLPVVCCSTEPSAAMTISAADLLKQIQTTYSGGGFTARFDQVSTLKAMDITDTASGRAYFMDPGKMRWEYVEPEPQQIITDGKDLWIYKPLDNQVMTGAVSALFKDGQGVNLLAAMRTIQEQYEASIDRDRTREGYYALKLVPNEKSFDLAAVYFYISRQNGLIEEVETINLYDDTTRIVFSDIHLGGSLEPSLFTFSIPENADVLILDPRE